MSGIQARSLSRCSRQTNHRRSCIKRSAMLRVRRDTMLSTLGTGDVLSGCEPNDGGPLPLPTPCMARDVFECVLCSPPWATAETTFDDDLVYDLRAQSVCAHSEDLLDHNLWSADATSYPDPGYQTLVPNGDILNELEMATNHDLAALRSHSASCSSSAWHQAESMLEIQSMYCHDQWAQSHVDIDFAPSRHYCTTHIPAYEGPCSTTSCFRTASYTHQHCRSNSEIYLDPLPTDSRICDFTNCAMSGVRHNPGRVACTNHLHGAGSLGHACCFFGTRSDPI